MIQVVQADSARYNMTVDADDWYWSNLFGNTTGSTTLYSVYSHDIDPLEYKYSFFKFDTSGLVDNVTVNELRFNFYGHSYTVTARSGLSLIYDLGITNNYVNEENYVTCNQNVAFGVAGWKNINMTSSCLQYVNKTGPTYIRIVVPDPGVGYYRLMQTRAREYTGDYDAYLNVSWTNAIPVPTINLTYPFNNQNISINTTGNNTDFKFNLTSEATINNCSLVINNTINKTITTGINKTNGENKIEFELNNSGYYQWYTNCTYNSSYKAKSTETWYFNVSNVTVEIPPVEDVTKPITIKKEYPLILFLIIFLIASGGIKPKDEQDLPS